MINLVKNGSRKIQKSEKGVTFAKLSYADRENNYGHMPTVSICVRNIHNLFPSLLPKIWGIIKKTLFGGTHAQILFSLAFFVENDVGCIFWGAYLGYWIISLSMSFSFMFLEFV